MENEQSLGQVAWRNLKRIARYVLRFVTGIFMLGLGVLGLAFIVYAVAFTGSLGPFRQTTATVVTIEHGIRRCPIKTVAWQLPDGQRTEGYISAETECPRRANAKPGDAVEITYLPSNTMFVDLKVGGFQIAEMGLGLIIGAINALIFAAAGLWQLIALLWPGATEG